MTVIDKEDIITDLCQMVTTVWAHTVPDASLSMDCFCTASTPGFEHAEAWPGIREWMRQAINEKIERDRKNSRKAKDFLAQLDIEDA